MKKPKIIGWERTINENGVVMATLPNYKLREALEYMEYAEKELEKLTLKE